jgi:hypothetical protein
VCEVKKQTRDGTGYGRELRVEKEEEVIKKQEGRGRKKKAMRRGCEGGTSAIRGHESAARTRGRRAAELGAASRAALNRNCGKGATVFEVP